jgi:hypothetical protein
MASAEASICSELGGCIVGGGTAGLQFLLEGGKRGVSGVVAKRLNTARAGLVELAYMQE